MLLHTDTLNDSLMSDNLFIITMLGLGLCLAFLIYKYYISHVGIILVPLFLAVVLGFRVSNKSWYKVILLCQVLFIFIGFSNYLIGSNYMYLAAKPLVNNPMLLGDWPWYIIGFEFLGFIHILVFFFGYRQMKPLPY